MIYLDNAATTRIDETVLEAVMDVYTKDFGNPSSLHRLGVNAERVVAGSRKSIAAAINASEREILFTSGGTESDNLAVMGALKANKRLGNRIVTSRTEHKAILGLFEHLGREGYEVVFAECDSLGRIDEESLLSSVDGNTALVSIMQVNNETGVINDIDRLSRLVKSKNGKTLFHSDCIQSFLKLHIDAKRMACVDMMSFSGHKVFAPKGVGALYVRKGVRILPIMYGGSQESSIRPGTENMAGIAGMGRAASLFGVSMASDYKAAALKMDRLINGIKSRIGYAAVIGENDRSPFSPYIASVSFNSIKAEVLLHLLESKGVYVSTGSACNAKSKEYSHVLNALGMAESDKEGTIRISISTATTDGEIEEAIGIIASSVDELSKIMRRGMR